MLVWVLSIGVGWHRQTVTGNVLAVGMAVGASRARIGYFSGVGDGGSLALRSDAEVQVAAFGLGQRWIRSSVCLDRASGEWVSGDSVWTLRTLARNFDYHIRSPVPYLDLAVPAALNGE